MELGEFLKLATADKKSSSVGENGEEETGPETPSMTQKLIASLEEMKVKKPKGPNTTSLP